MLHEFMILTPPPKKGNHVQKKETESKRDLRGVGKSRRIDTDNVHYPTRGISVS